MPSSDPTKEGTPVGVNFAWKYENWEVAGTVEWPDGIGPNGLLKPMSNGNWINYGRFHCCSENKTLLDENGTEILC